MIVTVCKAVVLLLIGFVFLVKGADYFVEGASSAAKLLKVPPLIIGMTIVAMGTSLPETSVSLAAALKDQNALAVSNAVGSNIFNLMVVLGVCAAISELKVSKDVLKRDYPFSVICAILLLIAGWIGMTLGRLDGILFLIIFVCFLLVLIKNALDARKRGEISEKEAEMAEEMSEMEDLPVWKCILFIICGGVAIKFGGDWVVNSAATIAGCFGISQTLIGLTICSVGTSLPELVTSITAARKNELDMAIGNVVGSNVFNILMVLGIASSVSPIAFLMENVIDIAVLLVFSLITWLFCVTKKKIGRKEGIAMLVMYAIYLVYICVR